MTLPLLQTDLPTELERKHRTLMATSINELIRVRPPHDLTPAEREAGIKSVTGEYAPGDVRRYGQNTAPGTTDMTDAVRAAIAVSATHRAVFQAETYLSAKLTPPAGASIFMPPGCVLKDTGALDTNERFLNITNDNIHIVGYGAQILMTRADYVSGEQRHGVNIRDAENIWIYGLASNSSGGDGFYVGGDSGPSVNVHLIDCSADDNRRQGLSIVNVRILRVVDFQGTNTNGTAPSAGIDIEPNSSTNVLEDIKIIRPRCTDNDGPGYEIFLDAWNATSNYADIEIVEPYSARNGAVTISGRRRGGFDVNRISSGTPCSGRVSIIDAKSVDDEQAGFHIYDWDKSGPMVEIIRPTVINPNQSSGVVSAINGGIILHNSTTHTTTPGNVRIVDPLVRDDDGLINAGSLAPYRISGIWDNVEIVNPRYAYAGSNPWSISDTAAEIRFRTDTPIVSPQGSTQTFTDGRYLGRTVTNASSGSLITYTLNAASADRIGWRYRFEVTGSGGIAIDPNGTDTIRGGTSGDSISSTTIGDSIELECDSATTWKIVAKVGGWPFAASTFAITNEASDYSYDADATTTDELADVLATLIKDLGRGT